MYTSVGQVQVGDGVDAATLLTPSSMSKSEIQGMQDGFDEAVKTIDSATAAVTESEGLSKFSFFLGIINVVVTAIVFAKWPAHFWLLYGAKGIVMIPAWLFRVSQVYNGALFVLDFCWVVNICSAAYMLLSVFLVVPPAWHRSMFVAFFSVALGPLSWACILLHNGLVFHSIEKATSTFIHLTPTLVAFTIRWESTSVTQAWPRRFPDMDVLSDVSAMELFSHGMIVYLVWLTFHSLWLLSVGVNCPAAGHNTVFDDLYKKQDLATAFTSATKLQGIRSHAALYLVLHCLAVSLSFLWPIMCWKFVGAHICWGIVLFVSAAWNGACYYDYIMAKKYAKIVKQMLAEHKDKQ